MGENTATSRRADLLQRRQQLSNTLKGDPYNILAYLRRALVYANLAYPDLAVGDCYLALRLLDKLNGHKMRALAEEFEKNGLPDVLRGVTPGDVLPESSAWSDDQLTTKFGYHWMSTLPTLGKLAWIIKARCYQIMSLNLLLCGCLGSADSFCQRGLAMSPENTELRLTKSLIDTAARQRMHHSGRAYDAANLPDHGLVRREVYPWNTYEPDRCSPASLAVLNLYLAEVAPKCEMRVVRLPILATPGPGEDAATPATRWQLGMFAKEPIAAGEVVLREYSLLTANNRHKDASCDACGSAIPAITANGAANDATYMNNSSEAGLRNGYGGGGVSCGERDVVFCDKFCHDRAQKSYRNCPCKTAVDIIANAPKDLRDADDALYVLLLERLLKMHSSQRCHPLEIKEVKYLWGDFVSVTTNERNSIGPDFSVTSPEVVAMAAAGGIPPAAWSLPFNFQDNIVKPLSFIETIGLNVYESLPCLDVWVLNTLYAKLRGTASARKSRQDGPPDVAAVHPFWSLANHDCDPNVTWEWGDRMVLRAKEERVNLAEDKAAGTTRPGGIAAGEEIFSHYCDVDLPVQQRRDWARGSLGGTCMCLRCQNEAAAERGESLATSSTNSPCTCSCPK
ncbi:hypothetical protein SEPCBS119000_000706 [Sporothrix epigloea]|uniref:SET domain-containing protein n=1 Tax=Sporothrix epigloea TaxID=1892477 RepID=A0ABP0D6K5_9PEZI